MSRRLQVATDLTDDEYKLLLRVYAKHNSSMGLEMRKKYFLSSIVKVERNAEERCLNVHYENGDWWHYCPNGTWY